MKQQLIKTHVDAHGHTCYVVAGEVTVYNEQEAIDLTATGVFPVRCMLTLVAMNAPEPVPYIPSMEPLPESYGELRKFPWEK